MMIKEYKLNLYEMVQRVKLQSSPIAVASVDNILRLYAYAGEQELYPEEEYVFICIKSDEEFDPTILNSCHYLGTVVVGGVGPFGGLLQSVRHIYYGRQAAFIPVKEKEPDKNLFAEAFAEFEKLNKYKTMEAHSPERQMELAN